MGEVRFFPLRDRELDNPYHLLLFFYINTAFAEDDILFIGEQDYKMI